MVAYSILNIPSGLKLVISIFQSEKKMISDGDSQFQGSINRGFATAVLNDRLPDLQNREQHRPTFP
jgi:hypothetical protein